MPVLYVTEPGAVLRKTSERLVVTKDEQQLAAVPAFHVEQVVIFGPAHLTTPALTFLLERGIDVVFLSSRGKYFGRLVASDSGFGALRVRQYEVYSDPPRRLALARAFVQAKLRNQRAFLQRRARRSEDTAVEPVIAQLERCLAAVARAADLDTLRGQEGLATRAYFAAYRTQLKQDLGFRARVRRPPTDPVNSMLSLGYTLLAYNVQVAVQTVGLDPYLGLLHGIERTRPSLVLDLMEEFRPVIVDALVAELVNERILTAADFEQPEDGCGAVLLTARGRRVFLERFEERIQTRTTSPDGAVMPSYRRWFERQARQVAQVLLGRSDAYRPFRLR